MNFKYFLLLMPLFFFGQTKDSIVINGEIKNATRSVKVVVKKFGVGFFDVAAVPIKDGNFKLVVPKNIEPGVYRFQYEQNNPNGYFDIIINGVEDIIDFIYDVDTPQIPIYFNSSLENKNWYNQKTLEKRKFEIISVLYDFLNSYPSIDHNIYKEVRHCYDKEWDNLLKLRNVFINSNSGYYAQLMIANVPLKKINNPKENKRLLDFERYENYWSGIDTSNPKIINTPLYTEHILEYLKYYMNSDLQFSDEELESGYMRSVDTIVHRFSKNIETNRFAIQYLQLGFGEIGQEKVLQYIDEKYVKNIDLESQDEVQLNERLNSYRLLRPGSVSPDFSIKLNDLNTTMHNMNFSKKILFFWSSECPHCTEILSIIDEWAKMNKDVVVVGISLDNIESEYVKSISKYKNIIHYCDFMGWESEPFKKYFIQATPTFFILYGNIIVDKLSSWELVLNTLITKR